MNKMKEFLFKHYRLINIFLGNRFHGKKLFIKNDGAILKNNIFINKGTNNKIYFGNKSIFKNCIFEIYGSNNTICFGNNCHAAKGSFYIEDANGNIKTGNNTIYAGKIHIACTEGKNIIIGDDCLFSSEIVIRNGDSHSIINETGERINQARDVLIGNHVWVGHRAVILKGSMVLDNSIVGSCAVIAKRIDKCNVAIAGNPASIIKENVNWDNNRI